MFSMQCVCGGERYKCIYTCMCSCVCLCIHVEAPGDCWISSPVALFPVPLRQAFSQNIEFAAFYAGWTQPSLSSVQHWGDRHMWPHTVFMWILRTQTQVFLLVWVPLPLRQLRSPQSNVSKKLSVVTVLDFSQKLNFLHFKSYIICV